MKYQIGDKIIVLHSDEEGKVIDILNDKMVMIEVRGVKFPAYMDQIDFPYFKMFTQKKIPEKKKIFVDQVKQEKKQVKQKTGEGVFLNFIPVFDKDVFDDEVVEKLKVYLINQDETAYYFNYNLFFGTESNFQLKNTIEPLSDFYLHDITFEDMNDGPRFTVEFSLVRELKKKADYFETTLKIKAKQLFRKIEDLQKNNQPSFAYQLFDIYPDKVHKEKVDLSSLEKAGFRLYDADKGLDYLPPARSVIDLHIEKLSDQPEDMKSAEMLALQLTTFDTYFDLAVAHKQPQLTVIHGIGEGVLRDELHQRLKQKREVKSFVNQFHPQYGYGATEIYFNLK